MKVTPPIECDILRAAHDGIPNRTIAIRFRVSQQLVSVIVRRRVLVQDHCRHCDRTTERFALREHIADLKAYDSCAQCTARLAAALNAFQPTGVPN